MAGWQYRVVACYKGNGLTSPRRVHTIDDVTSKWFIPSALLFFVAIVTLMWFYSSQGAGLADRRESIVKLTDPDFERLMEKEIGAAPPVEKIAPVIIAPPVPKTEAEATVSIPAPRQVRTQIPSGPSLSFLAQCKSRVSSLANTLDDISVQYRNNISHNDVLQLSLGWLDFRTGQSASALNRFDRILMKQPNHIGALKAKAEVLITVSRFRDAVDVYSRLVKLQPDDVDARFNFSVVLFRVFDTARASEELHEVIRRCPTHAKALYNLASLSQRDGRLSEARDAWMAFTKLCPNVAGGWLNLGLVQLDLFDPTEAAKSFTMLIRTDPDHSDGFVNAAAAEEQAEQLQSALHVLTLANELFPCDLNVMDSLADLHRRLAALETEDRSAHIKTARLLEAELESLEVPLDIPDAIVSRNADNEAP